MKYSPPSPQVTTLILIIPIQTFAGKLFRRYYKKLREASDVRIAHVCEIIGAIRLVKFEAWEQALGAKMAVLRDNELRQLWLKSVTRIFDTMLTNGAPVLVSVCHAKSCGLECH